MTNTPHRNGSATIAIPSQQEIDLRITQARRAQSAGLRHLVAGTFGAFERRVHHTGPHTE